MKNLQTGTTCLSSSTGSKQHKCERSLLRLATFVILFLCSMTVAWAEEMTTDKTFSFTQTSKDWVKGNTVKVRTFTKRVDDSDEKNYRENAEATQEFSNTGSTELASVDAPVITPGGEAVVATRLEVTISDKQWTSTLADKLKVYYAIEEGSYGNVTTSTWTKAPGLPLTLPLNKTSTVKAYAEYTASDGQKTKSATVSCTYFLLDDATTYLNTATATSQNVGTTVEKNGMTMTFGGINDGSSNFKALSKNDNTDNTLGSIHTVSGKALYGTADVESELGDGKIGGKNKSHEYLHCNALSQELHERTFALPAVGSFFKFEPDANGKLTVFVEQQGAIHNTNKELVPDVVRKRPVYFLDETGKSIPANYAYTSSKVNEADWTTIKQTKNKDGDTFYTKEYMDKLQAYYQKIIDGNNQDFTNFNSAVTEAEKHAKLTLGTSIQPIIVLHEKCNAEILKGDGMSETGDTEYDQTGYMLISEGYVTYEFPVKAGKTYYLFASRTKLALSGFCFDKDADYKTENLQNVTLEGDKDNATTIEGLTVGNQYKVTLNRTFGANKWYSVVLPFSVSQKQMKSVFGPDVKVLHYSDVTGTDLNLFEHFYQMIVGGTPVLVKPSQEVTNPVFKNVTLTSQKVVDIENTGFKCTGSWDNVDFPEYSYFIDAKTNSFYQYDPTKVETNRVKPHAGAFRSWVIASENASTAKQLTMHINGIEEQGETTAIWNAISGNNDAEVATKGIYSLSGQKMNAADTSSLPKGIYIVNGKKFIVK